MKASKAYRRFTNNRNKALENILDVYRAKITVELRKCFSYMLGAYEHRNITSYMDHVFRQTASRIAHLQAELRIKVYILTTASEAEILGRLFDKKKTIKIQPKYKPLTAGGDIYSRTMYYLNNLKRKLDARNELANLKNEPLTQQEILSVFPKLKVLRTMRPELKKVRESDDIPTTLKKENFINDQIDDHTWDQIIDDAQLNLSDRSVDSFFTDEELLNQGDFPSGRFEGVTYQWELEQDVTHDFVQSVRDGQNDAANELGITDMVWIAIVDDRTDECCLWRDGLTTKQIEAELKGKRKNDECDAVTPPAHFNCRCDMEPVTDDLPEVVSNEGDFQEWLTS